MLTVYCCVPALCRAAEPTAEIVSLLTIVAEQNQIENPKAILKGKIESVSWQQIRIERSPSGANKEVVLQSRRTQYDADGNVIEESDRLIGESRSTNTYENGRLASTKGRRFNAEGKPIGEESWQTYRYDAAGHLVEQKHGRGQKLENHFIFTYDAFGRLIREEIRQGEHDSAPMIRQSIYSGSPATIERRILTPQGEAKESAKLRLDESGNVTEFWSAQDGYHVRWKYDGQRRVVEQTTDPYAFPGGCDECPLPGAIRTRYEDRRREQTFFEPGGKAVLQRITLTEQDGSIASIRYERPAGADPRDAPDLYRVVNAITPRGGERYIETDWDDRGNWIEKRECFRPQAGPTIVAFVYRRKIAYR